MKPETRKSNGPVISGRIKWFDAQKGFGFILRDDADPDIFIHISAVRTGKEQIQPGAAVEFEVESGPRGLRAANVRLKHSAATQNAQNPVL